MLTAEETEKEFDNFFNQIGFTKVTADVGTTPTFENADYVNKDRGIVVELKILIKDHFKEGGIIDSLNALVVQPTNIDSSGAGQYKFSLPPINREGKHDNFEEPLRRILKKANKQLRQTRDFYFQSNFSTGLVVLAQTGSSSLDPIMTTKLVQKLLNYEFSSINGVIICTPHYQLRNPMAQRNNPICLSVTNELIPVYKMQCMTIADELADYIANLRFTRDTP